MNIFFFALHPFGLQGIQHTSKVGWMDGWIIFYLTFFAVVFVISRGCSDDYERLHAIEPCLPLRFRLERGSNSGPLDQ